MKSSHACEIHRVSSLAPLPAAFDVRKGLTGTFCKVSVASPCRRTIPLERAACIEDTMLRFLSYLTLAFSLGATATEAQHYPDHPVKVMVGYAAGSGPDIQARTVSAQLSLDLGQQFFVENRTGANGTIGTRAVVQAKPDGYTILYSSNGIAPK